MNVITYRGADKSLARPGRKQSRKHVRDPRDFNNIETRAVIKFFFFFFLQDKAPKEIYAILTETLACFLPGRVKDLSAHLCMLCPCFSNYVSSRNPKNATERTEEAPPVDSKSDIKLNISICLSFMYFRCNRSAANLKLIANMIVLPDT